MKEEGVLGFWGNAAETESAAHKARCKTLE